MDGVSSALSALNNPATADEGSVLVLKKALNIQAQSVAQLLQSLPKAPPVNPPHLGNALNTYS
jgi:hypothetical protein